MIVKNVPNIHCAGSIVPSNGSLRIEFSPVRCSDEGQYTCAPNAKASMSKTARLIVTSKYSEITLRFTTVATVYVQRNNKYLLLMHP